MSDAENLFGDEHVRRYRETNGDVGHIWREGSTILLLTTTGCKTGLERTKPLIYDIDGDNPVIVASKGGAPPSSPLVPQPRRGPERGGPDQGRAIPGKGAHR